MHTLAPWHVETYCTDEDGKDKIHEIKSGEACVAFAENEDDACLIAAAPRLLEACKAAMEAAATLPSGNEQFDRQILDEVYRMTAAVIAEAEGEEPA